MSWKQLKLRLEQRITENESTFNLTPFAPEQPVQTDPRPFYRL